jgi:hypothetical protein
VKNLTALFYILAISMIAAVIVTAADAHPLSF